MAQDLRRLAQKSSEDLILDYRREVAKGHAAQLYNLRTQLAATRDFDSGNWKGYLERGIVELEGAIQKEWGPADIDGVEAGSSNEQVVEEFRRMLLGFAGALEAWDLIRDVCRATDGGV